MSQLRSACGRRRCFTQPFTNNKLCRVKLCIRENITQVGARAATFSRSPSGLGCTKMLPVWVSFPALSCPPDQTHRTRQGARNATHKLEAQNFAEIVTTEGEIECTSERSRRARVSQHSSIHSFICPEKNPISIHFQSRTPDRSLARVIFSPREESQHWVWLVHLLLSVSVHNIPPPPPPPIRCGVGYVNSDLCRIKSCSGAPP